MKTKFEIVNQIKRETHRHYRFNLNITILHTHISACFIFVAWKCNKCLHVNGYDRRRKECEMCCNQKPQRGNPSRDHHHDTSRESFA